MMLAQSPAPVNSEHRNVLEQLPERDGWPGLVRGLFAIPVEWPAGTFQSHIIHFGGFVQGNRLYIFTMHIQGVINMRKATAVTAVCLGVVAITFAVASHLHLRNLATASPPVDVSRFVEFPILSIGMLDTTTPAMIDPATFARSLAYRIYATGVAGFVFLLIGGCLFRSRQRSDAHELQAPC